MNQYIHCNEAKIIINVPFKLIFEPAVWVTDSFMYSFIGTLLREIKTDHSIGDGRVLCRDSETDEIFNCPKKDLEELSDVIKILRYHYLNLYMTAKTTSQLLCI